MFIGAITKALSLAIKGKVCPVEGCESSVEKELHKKYEAWADQIPIHKQTQALRELINRVRSLEKKGTKQEFLAKLAELQNLFK